MTEDNKVVDPGALKWAAESKLHEQGARIRKRKWSPEKLPVDTVMASPSCVTETGEVGSAGVPGWTVKL